MKNGVLLFLFIIGTVINSKGQYDYSRYLNVDYLQYNYKYLDKDLNIKVSEENFQEWVLKYDFFQERITRYKDSLLVVLTEEFGNKHQSSIATRRITFTWLRVGYYIWLSELEAEELGHKYGFNHPYRFYEYFHTDNDSIWDNEMIEFMNKLRAEVQVKTNNPNVWKMSTKKFLSYSLVNNPERIKDFEEYKRKINSKDNCKEENCCQSKDSNKEPCDSVIVSK